MTHQWTDTEWHDEMKYIWRTAAQGGKVAEMRNDPEVFVTYCQMQKRRAEKEGRVDTAAEIERQIKRVQG